MHVVHGLGRDGGPGQLPGAAAGLGAQLVDPQPGVLAGDRRDPPVGQPGRDVQAEVAAMSCLLRSLAVVRAATAPSNQAARVGPPPPGAARGKPCPGTQPSGCRSPAAMTRPRNRRACERSAKVSASAAVLTPADLETTAAYSNAGHGAPTLSVPTTGGTPAAENQPPHGPVQPLVCGQGVDRIRNGSCFRRSAGCRRRDLNQ